MIPQPTIHRELDRRRFLYFSFSRCDLRPGVLLVSYFDLCFHKYVNPPVTNSTPTSAVLEKNSAWGMRINTTTPTITAAIANKMSKTFIALTPLFPPSTVRKLTRELQGFTPKQICDTRCYRGTHPQHAVNLLKFYAKWDEVAYYRTSR